VGSSTEDAATPPRELVDRLARHGQGQVLAWWGDLDAAGRARLRAELAALDLDQVDRLIAELVRSDGLAGDAPADAEPEPEPEPVEVCRLPRTDGERVARRPAIERGEALLDAGRVAVVIVAGGQGTRLGFDGPKGTFPIGPVSGASLFQVHAEKVVALSRRHGTLVPLYIMTSPENDAATRAFFREHGNFGLDHVRFFVQGQMPAVDRESGRLLLADKGRLALSPDGHGGTLRALAAPAGDGGPSPLAEMRDRGVTAVFYFQVDNPLVQVADPAFLGLHARAEADVSFKVVEKILPDERVGVVVSVGGKPRVIEYSDLPPALAEAREADNTLRYWAGSIAIHVFERAFLDHLAGEGGRLPFHRAFKKVPFVDASGRRVEPSAPNAVKFEQFIFDTLPMAGRYAIVETDRVVEFEPLKNATGAESPETVKARMSDLFAGWLESAGATVARREDGSVPFPIEISPLYALDAAELRAKFEPGAPIAGPLLLR
jgi:UDP-N-acetylglucosamine/UDP-N-acetylgalactosamine diphosphorylase